GRDWPTHTRRQSTEMHFGAGPRARVAWFSSGNVSAKRSGEISRSLDRETGQVRPGEAAPFAYRFLGCDKGSGDTRQKPAAGRHLGEAGRWQRVRCREREISGVEGRTENRVPLYRRPVGVSFSRL